MLHNNDRSVYGFRYGISKMFAMVDDLEAGSPDERVVTWHVGASVLIEPKVCHAQGVGHHAAHGMSRPEIASAVQNLHGLDDLLLVQVHALRPLIYYGRRVDERLARPSLDFHLAAQL